MIKRSLIKVTKLLMRDDIKGKLNHIDFWDTLYRYQLFTVGLKNIVLTKKMVW